ncbi:hypothetical protein [Reichenbachiella sp. MALMAid0571]|uniref:hypothetical protein n=1 Tax=Reichenbachiella sp. MALMAid0571 TaxID=3143939 RepID=UPI0032DF6CBE
MRHIKIILIICLLSHCGSCLGQGLTKQDYKTYSIILDEFLKEDEATKNLIIIQSESDTIFRGGDSTDQSDIRKLESRMKHRIKFDNDFIIKGRKSIVITEKEFRSLTVDENRDLIWDPLYKKYPNAEGVIFLSAIHYTSDDKTTGILQISLYRNELSGGCFFVKFDLKKKGKKTTRTLTEVA